MNEIVPRAQSGFSYAELERLAASIAQSGLFGIKTRDQAIALMMIAHAEGRHPALAARDYDIIQGRPAKKSEAMLRDFLEAGGKVQWHTLSDEMADVTFTHPAGGTVRIEWDMKRAAQAGLGGKDNWKKFPRQMLRSRAISEGVRTVYPTATSGMYVPEEAAEMEHKGPTLDAKAEAPETPAKPGGMVETARAALQDDTPKGPTLKEVVARICAKFAQAQSMGGVVDIEKEDDTQKVLAREPTSDARKAVIRARDDARERLSTIMQDPATGGLDGWPSEDEAAAVMET